MIKSRKGSMRTVRFTPIGWITSSVDAPIDEHWGGVVSRINLTPGFVGGLKGLAKFSHAIVVTYLHKSKYEPSRHLQRRPRGLRTMPIVGIFSQRAKDRPNPIGVTAVKIIAVGDDHLEVRGLDAIDTTPVLDIKPYFPEYDRVKNPTTPNWVKRLMKGYF